MNKKRALSNTSEHIIIWKIKDPKKLFQTSYPGEFFISEELKVGDNFWYLDMYPKGSYVSKTKKNKKNQSHQICLWLSLNQLISKAGPVDVPSYEISILDKNGNAFHVEKSKELETFDPRTSGLPENNGKLTDCRGWFDFHPSAEVEKNWDQLINKEGHLVVKCVFKVKNVQIVENNNKRFKPTEKKQDKKKNQEKEKINNKQKKTNEKNYLEPPPAVPSTSAENNPEPEASTSAEHNPEPVASTSADNNIDDIIELLFSDDNQYDVKIKSKNNKEYNAHKKVLCRHSELLKVYFEENDNNIIDMSKYDSKVVLEMLRFIYTGQVGDIDNTVVYLNRLSSAFGLTSLQELCEQELVNALNLNKSTKNLNVKTEELNI